MPDDLEGCTFEPKINRSKNRTPDALTNKTFHDRLTFDQTRRRNNHKELLAQLNKEYKAKYGNGKP